MSHSAVVTVAPARRVVGTLRVPGDKSVAHRYALFAALADGRSELTNFAPGADCRSTLACLRQLGVDIVVGPAGAVTVVGEDYASKKGLKPLGRFLGFAVAGCEPDEMGIGPVYAVPKVLRKLGLKVSDIDLWELNEAFAVQVLYCRDRLGIPTEKLNPNGGSIAIGHPFGMTGSRLVGTLAYEMKRRGSRYGVVTMCVGGGQGGAALFERA